MGSFFCARADQYQILLRRRRIRCGRVEAAPQRKIRSLLGGAFSGRRGGRDRTSALFVVRSVAVVGHVGRGKGRHPPGWRHFGEGLCRARSANQGTDVSRGVRDLISTRGRGTFWTRRAVTRDMPWCARELCARCAARPVPSACARTRAKLHRTGRGASLVTPRGGAQRFAARAERIRRSAQRFEVVFCSSRDADAKSRAQNI